MIKLGSRQPSNRYLLLLGADMSLRERSVAAALRVYDGPVAGVFRRPFLNRNRYFDAALEGDPMDAQSTLEAVLRFEGETGSKPEAVVPFIDPSVPAGLTVAEHYGLPYLSRFSVEHSSVNKNRMKERLLASGVRTARFRLFTSLAELREASKELGFPCVLKPSGFGGSMGVIRVDDETELAKRYEYCSRIFEANRHEFSIKNPHLQVEEYIPARYEVSVEVFNHRGRRAVLGVTDKALGPEPFFAEMGHRVPSEHTSDVRLTETALAACEALRLEHGMAHVEVRMTPAGEPVVVEVGARTAGDGILDLVERVSGVSPYEWHIRSYLNRDVGMPEPAEARGSAAIAFLKAEPGTIARVTPPARVPSGVLGVAITARPGDASGVAECYEQREGSVECFWPAGDAPHPTAHLELAQRLTAEIFEVERSRGD